MQADTCRQRCRQGTCMHSVCAPVGRHHGTYLQVIGEAMSHNEAAHGDLRHISLYIFEGVSNRHVLGSDATDKRTVVCRRWVTEGMENTGPTSSDTSTKPTGVAKVGYRSGGEARAHYYLKYAPGALRSGGTQPPRQSSRCKSPQGQTSSCPPQPQPGSRSQQR